MLWARSYGFSRKSGKIHIVDVENTGHESRRAICKRDAILGPEDIPEKDIARMKKSQLCGHCLRLMGLDHKEVQPSIGEVHSMELTLEQVLDIIVEHIELEGDSKKTARMHFSKGYPKTIIIRWVGEKNG